MDYSTVWLVFILVIVVCFGLAAILPKAGPTLSKPVKHRQMDFMDALIAEREVPSRRRLVRLPQSSERHWP